MTEERDYLAEYQLMNNPSPHFKHTRTSPGVMLHVLIALLFPTASALYYFDAQRVFVMIGVGVGSAVLFEYIIQKLLGRPVQVGDGSAAVTGYLLALALPTTAPLWTILVGTGLAIILIKHLIGGGIGKNLLNPAVFARVVLKLVFPQYITNWVLPGPDAISTATPLEYIGQGARTVAPEVPGLLDLFLGQNLGGPVGETSKLAILLAMIYLAYNRIIKIRIPLIYLGTLFIMALLWSGFNLEYALTHVLSGTAVFGAVFMVTDYSSTPITQRGHEVFAIGAAIIGFLVRFYVGYWLAGGFGVGVLVMNLASPWLDKYFAPRIYGHDQAPQVLSKRELRAAARIDKHS